MLVAIGLVTVLVVVVVGRYLTARFQRTSAARADTSTASPKATAVVELEIRCDAPSAEVKLRDKTFPLPYVGEIGAADSPEIIMVTAPDREGRSLKITFDRPRRLWVSLPRGSGLAEATDQEIAQALDGEPDPTRTTVPLIPTLAQRPSVPRPANDPRPERPGNTSGDTPPPRHPDPPASAAVQPPVQPTNVEPVVPQPQVPAPPEVKPGTVDPKGVRAAVRAHSDEVQNCYERARIEMPDLRGRVSVGATINPTGQVISASIGAATAKSPRLHACLLDAFRGWTFPAPSGGVNGSITYNFVFD